MLMIYGRALLELSNLQNTYDLMLLDEIHRIGNILALYLELTRDGVKYKCVHLTKSRWYQRVSIMLIKLRQCILIIKLPAQITQIE